jgi:phage/plasmid-like protein (TIGR03299 family)
MTATLEAPVTTAVEAPIQTAPESASKSFTSRQAPWLKLGPQIDGDVNAAEAAKLGGLDFTVELRSARFDALNENGSRTNVTVPQRKAIVRTDRFGVSSFIDFVSKDYEVVQYADAFTFMDDINPRYVAAGSMSDGKQGFIVAQLPDVSQIPLEINGVLDPHDYYVILRTSHDRSKAMEISLMPLRGLCMNQLALNSMTQSAPQRWSIKHIGNVQDKMVEAQRVLKVAPKYAEIFAAKARQLGSVSVTDEDSRSILKRVLPDKVKRDETIDAIMSTYHNDPTVGFVGTGWGLANAVSTYYDWGRNDGTRTDQSKFTSGLTGDTAKFFNRTAQLLLNR